MAGLKHDVFTSIQFGTRHLGNMFGEILMDFLGVNSCEPTACKSTKLKHFIRTKNEIKPTSWACSITWLVKFSVTKLPVFHPHWIHWKELVSSFLSMILPAKKNGSKSPAIFAEFYHAVTRISNPLQPKKLFFEARNLNDFAISTKNFPRDASRVSTGI